jgi:hypothetical protein
MNASGIVRASWVLAVAFFVVTGLWALVSPGTFLDALVAFPPYNAHLMWDIGVFTLGHGERGRSFDANRRKVSRYVVRRALRVGAVGVEYEVVPVFSRPIRA